MQTNGHEPPTEGEWAAAELHVDRYDIEDEPTIFRLRKAIHKHGKTYSQSVWLSIRQLRAVAEDQLRR